MKNIAHPSEKQLLFSVDGQVPVGALCAVMGPSGSGKPEFMSIPRLVHEAGHGTCGWGYTPIQFWMTCSPPEWVDTFS